MNTLKLAAWVTATLGTTLGHGAAVPDLSGTYDLATLTPLQRPAAFGNNKFLSPQEAEAIRQAEAQRKKVQAKKTPEKKPPVNPLKFP